MSDTPNLTDGAAGDPMAYVKDLPNVQAIVQAAREHADPRPIDPTKLERNLVVVPAGARVQIVEPDERALDQPRRLHGEVTVDTVESLKAYVAEFHDASANTVWVDTHQQRVVAVLNDAHQDEAAWRDHRATLQLRKTPEWQRWRKLDGQLMGQEAFAEHIEDSEADIVSPDAADLLEIAQTFYASTKAEFRSGTRLQTGEVQFEWVEEHNAQAGRKGDMSIPATFDLAIAPFEGEARCRVTARLRYRLRDGNLALGFKLVRPDDIERDALDLIATSLREEVARVYIGSPARS